MSSNSVLGILVALVGLTSSVFSTDAKAQPAAPSDTDIMIQGENALDVTWVDNSDDESAFDIFRRDGVGDSRLVGAVDADLTLFQDRASGIVPNVRYCYTVRARNGAGSSPPSAEACVVIPPRPVSPSGLITSRTDNNSPISLTWIDNSTNELGFLIYRDTRGTGFILEDTVAASSSRYDDMEVRSNGQYCYFVSAFNVSGESEISNTSCIEVTTGEPALPTSFEALPVSGSEIDLMWEFGFVSHARLAVERSVGGADPWTEVFSTTDLVTNYRDSDLDSDTEFCYRLVLESASNVSAMTEAVCARTEFTPPPAPKEVDAVGLSGQSIRVTWSIDPSPEVLFRVERRAGLGSFSLIADSVDAFVFTDFLRSENEVYCYRIQAFNPQFASPVSSVACAIVAPAPVANLRVSAGGNNPTGSLSAAWSQGTGTPATSFEVSYRVVGDEEFSAPAVTNGLTYLINNLTDATEYEVQVVAFRARDSLSAQSEGVIASGSTLLGIWPGDIDDDGSVTANDVVLLTSPDCFGMTTSLSSDGLDVSWRERAVDPAGADPLLLRCDADQTGTIDIFDFLAIAANAGRQTGKARSSNSTPYAVTSQAHFDRIRQIYDSFVPKTGNADQARLKSDLGAILEKAGAEILPDEIALRRVYPNPVSDHGVVGVDLPSDTRVRLSVFNVTGQEVKVVADQLRTAGHHEIALDTDGLAGGIYFLVLETEATVLTQSIIVAR